MPSTLIQPGAFNLGAIFAGGDRVREAAKTAEETRLIQRAQLQAETDRKVDQAIEEAAKRGAIQGVQNDDTMTQRDRNLTVGGLGTDWAGTQQGNLREQELLARAAAMKAALTGDMDGANANLVGVANGPLQLTKVEGNNVIRNPYSTQGSVTADEIGNALIGDHNAAARQHDAAANLSNVKAAGGGFAPKGAGKAGKFTEPTQGRVAAAFAGSPAMETDFLQWRAAHPEITDGNVALDNYRLLTASHGPHIITPGLPGSMSITPPSPADRSLEANLRDDAAPADVIDKVVQAVRGGKEFNIPAGRVPVHVAPAAIKHPPVPAAAVTLLRANPHLRAQFAEKYGDAAAKAALGE